MCSFRMHHLFLQLHLWLQLQPQPYKVFRTVDVVVAVEPLLLPLHPLFNFPILMVRGSSAGLSMGSYNRTEQNNLEN